MLKHQTFLDPSCVMWLQASIYKSLLQHKREQDPCFLTLAWSYQQTQAYYISGEVIKVAQISNPHDVKTAMSTSANSAEESERGQSVRCWKHRRGMSRWERGGDNRKKQMKSVAEETPLPFTQRCTHSTEVKYDRLTSPECSTANTSLLEDGQILSNTENQPF